LEKAWDENADPFSNAVRITISALRKRLGDPWVIHTVSGVGYRAGEAHDGGEAPGAAGAAGAARAVDAGGEP
jgi:two-component system response regulator VanR